MLIDSNSKYWLIRKDNIRLWSCFIVNVKQKLNVNDKNMRCFAVNWSWSKKGQFNNSGNGNNSILMTCIRNMGLYQLNSMQRTKQEIRLTIILIMMLLFPLFKNPFL